MGGRSQGRAIEWKLKPNQHLSNIIFLLNLGHALIKMTIKNLIIQILLLQTANAQCTAQGVSVTYKGLIMDNFCIERGTLLDNPSVRTLVNPVAHTIHCLVDVSSCVDSGYAVLAPPTTPGGLYSVKYQLGKDGTDLAFTEASKMRVQGQLAGFSMELRGIDDGSGTLKCVESTANSSAQATSKKNTGIVSAGLNGGILFVMFMLLN
jgi:hypothetical protein